MVYTFKVNNKDTRTAFIDIADIVLVSLLLILSISDINHCHKGLHVRCCSSPISASETHTNV